MIDMLVDFFRAALWAIEEFFTPSRQPAPVLGSGPRWETLLDMGAV